MCAALLHVAGAPWPAIEAEYLRSNDSFDAHRIAELMSTMTGEQLSAELAEPLLCRAEYLAGSFAVMRREAGSVDAYLATRAGVTAELRRRARAALLTPRG